MASKIRDFAEKELNILVKSHADPKNRPIIEPFVDEILALCDKFGNSGQSGGSAPFTAFSLSETIKKLCLQEPLSIITGEDDEWVDVSNLGDGSIMYQNSREAALFKNSENDRAYYLDAMRLIDENGNGWHGSAILPYGEKIRCKQYIKSFPFKPRTFDIDIISKEIKKDDWEFYIKDENQLIEVFEYYDPMEDYPGFKQWLIKKRFDQNENT